MAEADMPEIALRISLADLELVLAALGTRAYSEVAQVVHLLDSQASPQILAHSRKLELAATPTEARN